MKTSRLFILPLIFMITLSVDLRSQNIEVVSFKEFEKIINEPSGKLKVINFWATWCKPCIKEIPYFEAVNAEFPDQVEVILVSLDFANELDSKLNPYVKRKGMKSRILLLDDVDYNSWINLVDKSWSGAIPATLILSSDHSYRKFYEGEMDEMQLRQLIKPYIQ